MLAVVSNCYPPVQGRLPTRYSPVRHSVKSVRFRRLKPKCFVRLACVKHAASVHPEPGSNSHLKMWFVPARIFILAFPFLPMSRFCSFSENLFGGFSILRFFRIFRVGIYCLFVKVLLLSSQRQLVHSITACRLCQQLFYLFFSAFCCFSAATRLSYQNLLSLSTTFLIF